MTDQPGEHPGPPGNLADSSPLLHRFEPGTIFARIHHRDREPVFFGRTRRNRFDSPDGSFGVLYVGVDESCAFVETFLQDTGIRVVSRQELQLRHLARLELTVPLTVVDLSRSGGLARIGADARLFSGSHAIAQRWSAALRDHPSRPAGLLYPARHDPARNACALYDLPESAFKVTRIGSLLEPGNTSVLVDLLDRYDVGLID